MTGQLSVEDAINRLHSTKERSIEIVFRSDNFWPFKNHMGPTPADDQEDVIISVFDSSFNPPTLAHLSIALLCRPDSTFPFDAHLLLLSVTNADKKLTPTDATYVQRVEMMILLAHDMMASQPGIRVAVGIIDEPTFVGKCRVIQQTFGKESGKSTKDIRMWFGIGWDTLLRLFAPRYYGGMDAMEDQLEEFFDRDGSGVICARRGDGTKDEEKVFLATDVVKRWVDDGKVVMVDIGTYGGYSSTSIRDAIANGEDGWRSMCTSSIADYVRDAALYGKV
ncbi:Nucleotidylyl transferase [Dacryopinax primogenitus]|uniref:Nucleotidylyl transferase n=1 Tax=Dacryopinax primogenitus (strain DJM 731) TaxID=1858805 RepID=M5GG42_DACPD|nr:Nucleotidylyl transferase [Dacryopinax primogenitus]EJU04833.1 Nucleotidylyl transferase [Dacryopinax primogenitus]